MISTNDLKNGITIEYDGAIYVVMETQHVKPGKVAETIAKETGAETMQIQTLHNVSLEDFNNGETWVSLMTRNIDVLKKALQ